MKVGREGGRETVLPVLNRGREAGREEGGKEKGGKNQKKHWGGGRATETT